MAEHKLIRVLEYTFDDDKTFDNFLNHSQRAVPLNGGTSYGATNIRSRTFSPDPMSFTDGDILQEVIEGVDSQLLNSADLVVVITERGLQIVKSPTLGGV